MDEVEGVDSKLQVAAQETQIGGVNFGVLLAKWESIDGERYRTFYRFNGVWAEVYPPFNVDQVVDDNLLMMLDTLYTEAQVSQ